MLEVLQADKFTGIFPFLLGFKSKVLTDLDISLGQWIGSTPKQIVADTLKLPESALSKLKTEKQFVVAGGNETFA